MNKIILLVLLCLSLTKLLAQKHDYNWHLGYRSNDTVYLSHRGVTNINFNTHSLNPVFKYDSFKIIDFDWTCNDMSDEEGKYLFSYNGYTVENYLNKILVNGKGEFSKQQIYGDVVYQSGCILPTYTINKYILVHDEEKQYFDLKSYFSTGFRYSIVDMNTNNKTGSVIKKNYEILSDTLDYGRILAIKHANGRDWWIIRGRHDMRSFYKFITFNESIIMHDYQIIGEGQHIPFGGVTVSPNGNKIVYFYQADGAIIESKGEPGFFINIFDFNRVNGLMTNSKSFKISSDTAFLFGGVFSPNGKYLYISRINYLFQIDLTADSLVLDTVSVYDGFKYVSPGNFQYSTWFGFIERAPDGRIYGTTSCCTQQYLFYINKPNLKGQACDVRQHAIKITAHNNLPSFPNYRLGPIDGSTADSLGIDNVPVAEFRYDQDTNEYKKIEFTNLSWYEPDQWWWDWGDGSPNYYTTVKDTSITHNYAKDGVYQVCLRAKNMYGEHTICKEIKLGTTKTTILENAIDINIYPNPVQDMFIIQVEDYLPEKMLIRLYDINGQEIIKKRLFQDSNIIDVEILPAGIYFIEISERGKLVKTDKIVKM